MIKISSPGKVCLLSLMLLTAFSCTQTKDISLSEEKDKILALHNLQRDYHFNKDSVAFANQLSNNFISVNKGQITHPSIEATIARYNSYFSSVEFVRWDDVSEPIIKLSDDGSMAYAIVDKIVQVTYTDDNGKTQNGETHYAWMAIYKKYGTDWKIDAVTSTEIPSESN